MPTSFCWPAMSPSPPGKPRLAPFLVIASLASLFSYLVMPANPLSTSASPFFPCDCFISLIIDFFRLKAAPELITAVTIPFVLSSAELPSIPTDLPFPVSLSTVFTGANPEEVSNLKGLLEKGQTVDISIQGVLTDEQFEVLEDLIYKATEAPSAASVVICELTHLNVYRSDADNDCFLQLTSSRRRTISPFLSLN